MVLLTRYVASILYPVVLSIVIFFIRNGPVLQDILPPGINPYLEAGFIEVLVHHHEAVILVLGNRYNHGSFSSVGNVPSFRIVK